jgi:type VI protein secretion system component VasF
MTTPHGAKPHADRAERSRAALPLWLWMLLLTAAIVALLLLVGRNSFAA